MHLGWKGSELLIFKHIRDLRDASSALKKMAYYYYVGECNHQKVWKGKVHLTAACNLFVFVWNGITLVSSLQIAE